MFDPKGADGHQSSSNCKVRVNIPHIFFLWNHQITSLVAAASRAWNNQDRPTIFPVSKSISICNAEETLYQNRGGEKDCYPHLAAGANLDVVTKMIPYDRPRREATPIRLAMHCRYYRTTNQNTITTADMWLYCTCFEDLETLRAVPEWQQFIGFTNHRNTYAVMCFCDRTWFD